MNNKEEEFPFQQFIQALQQQQIDLKKSLKNILKAIINKNIYWTYSAISTITQILKSKDEDPKIQCRCLDVVNILVSSCQYHVMTLLEVFVLPLLTNIASYRGRKSQQLTSYYFQQANNVQDTPQTKQLSLEFVLKSIEILFLASKIKTKRLLEIYQLKEESLFVKNIDVLNKRGIQQPTKWKWVDKAKFNQYRKLFLEKIKKFADFSEVWTEFLLINLLEEVRSNKKQLLQIKLMIAYGESYLTSAVINFCEDQLNQMTENLDLKRKYLSLLNQLVRQGDIEAIISIKNSQFIPSIAAHISKLPPTANTGDNIYPQIKATKQVKKQFYNDFLRCLQTWSIAMPAEYDSQDFNIKKIYQFLKIDKKLKFPENIHLNRYKKQIKENLTKNQERNNKLIQILQCAQQSKQQSIEHPISKVSNILQRTTLLAPSQLEERLTQAQKYMKELLSSETSVDKNFKYLLQFKQNWIIYLETLDLQVADEEKLENLILSGQKCVEQIQLITPLHASLAKGKLTYRDFKERVKQIIEFHNDVSMNISQNASKKSINHSRSLIKSQLAKSKMEKSKMGKQLLQKIKNKSNIGNMSKLVSKLHDRTNMLEKSKTISHINVNKSVLQNSKSKIYVQEPSKLMNPKQEIAEKDKEDSRLAKKTPLVSKISNAKRDVQTVKRQISDFKAQQEDKIVRIEDYENIEQINHKVSENNRLSQSRQRGSKILLRRSQVKNSRIQPSNQSRNKSERKSVGSNKNVKETSLSNKQPRLSSKILKKSELQSKLENDQNKVINSIQANENVQKKDHSKLPSKLKEQNPYFDKFRNEASDISSIHSNSVMRVFRNSAQKILDITESKIQDKNRNMHDKCSKAQFQYNAHQYEAPLVGDYYTPHQKYQKPTPKKDMLKLQKNVRIQNIETKKIYDNKIKKNNSLPKRQNHNTVKLIQANQQQIHKIQSIISQKKAIMQKNQNKKEKQLKNGSLQHKTKSSSNLVEIRMLQNEKNKQIEALLEKIRDLEKQTMTMKTKLAAKDNELRSIRSLSKNGSERGFNQFTTVSQSNYEKSEKNSLRGSSVAKKLGQTSSFEKQIQSGFKQYLQRIKGSTFRKSLLKLKCLVHKTDEIQIGCMSQRNFTTLQCTLYITPHRYNLIDFTITIIHQNCLKIKLNPDVIKLIPVKKQQKIKMTIEILKIPFCLPELEINYKADSEYSSNYNRLTLPLAFNKFCEISPLDEQNTDNLQYIRSNNFKLNNKIVKLQKIEESFPHFSIIPPKKGRQQILLAAKCNFLDSKFNIFINLHLQNSWIQGFLKQGDIRAMNFLICTFKEIMNGSKK